MRFLSPASFRPPCVFFAFALVVLLAAQLAAAQSSPPVSKPPAPPPPPAATDQQQFLSYWTTETGWGTELQIRNNQVGQNLTVSPVLRTADGTETPLLPVVVQPQEVKTVDLATAIGSSAPQLIGTYGTLVLRYRAPNQVNLYAVSMVMGVGHSVAFHIDATGEDQTENVGSREGIWWLPNATANDYLVLMNQGENPLQLALSLFDANGKTSTQSLTLPPRGMNRLSVRQLVVGAGLAGPYGGIKVSAVNHAGSLDTLHVLFDEKAGFSAVMKMFYYDPRAQIKERDYAKTGQWTLRAPMLALSSPDPALAFPPGTILQPQLFVRNNTSKPTDVSLTFNWRSDTTSGKAPALTLRLYPNETRRIDVAALQDGKTLPQNAQWASVTLATSGLPDEVMAVAASYDTSLRYGAQTPFSDQLAAHWAGGQWQYDPYHNSMITAGNGGTKPTRAAFTIFYNHGTQRYDLVQTLQPGDQMWMDIGKLIREGVSDKNGNTLPADLTSGSYEVRDLTNKGIGTLFEGKVIYDKTYSQVTYGCAACCGWTTPVTLWYDPATMSWQGGEDDGVWSWYPCESQYDDVSSLFYYNWSSGDTTIATVNNYGTHTGVSVGSTTSQTYGLLQSNNSHVMCPNLYRNPSGGVTVMPKIMMNGTDITGTTQDAVAGQQISLSVSVGTLPSGVTVTGYTWAVPSSSIIVGGYSPNTTTSAPTAATLNAQSTSFYYWTIGTSQSVTVTLTLSGGSSSSASAATTFNVAGPTLPTTFGTSPNNGNFTVNTLTGCTGIPTGPWLVYGNVSGIAIPCPGGGFASSSTFGAKFALPTTTTPSGSFSFVQIVNTDTQNFDTTTCHTSAGLDFAYPYAAVISGVGAVDAPALQLVASTYTTEGWQTFNATMWLMWTPSGSSTVAVPLGYQTWSFSGSVTQSGGTWGTPTTNSFSMPSGLTQASGSITASTSHPTWSGLAGACQ
jgi:hypothetical protein